MTALVFDEQERVLLVRHADQAVWVARGGSIDPGEVAADAVVRETYEETGLYVQPMALLGVYGGPGFEITYRNGDQVAYVLTVFECRVIAGEPRPDGEETLDAQFVSEPDLSKGDTA